jgi:hypothetical protein
MIRARYLASATLNACEAFQIEVSKANSESRRAPASRRPGISSHRGGILSYLYIAPTESLTISSAAKKPELRVVDGFADDVPQPRDHGETTEFPGSDGKPFAQLSQPEQETLRDELQSRLAAYLRRGRPRVILTDNLHTMLSIKRGHGMYTLRMHHMFVDAPPVVLRAVARYAENQDHEASKLLRRFIDANDDKVRQRTDPRPVALDVEGKYHNLQEIFDELNEHYFRGRIQARITWGPRTSRKRGRESIRLGTYTVEDALIRIHPVLDAADVPRYFVAWVVYHEMLHEIHDMPVVDGRRTYHTREFREAEAQFDQYAEAVMWERANVHRLLDR